MLLTGFKSAISTRTTLEAHSLAGNETSVPVIVGAFGSRTVGSSLTADTGIGSAVRHGNL